MNKVLCLGVLLIGLFGCVNVNNPSIPPKISISIGSIGPISAGSSFSVTGLITSDSVINNVSYSIVDSSTGQADNSISFLAVVVPNRTSIDLHSDANLVIKTTTTTKTYKLTITVISGSVTQSSYEYFRVCQSGTALNEVTNISMGAQSANPPSLLSTTTMQTYSLTGLSIANQALIDVIFYYSTVSGVQQLNFVSPTVANGLPFSNWSVLNTTEFKEAQSSDYDQSTTIEDLTTLWGSSSGSSRIVINQGDVVLVKAVTGDISIIKINTLNGYDSYATINIKGKY